MRPTYLDWNATSPPHPEVVAAMAEAAQRTWGNPSSLHLFGRAAKACVEAARERVASVLGFSARDVVLTSGGTEANNLAVLRPFIDDAGAWRPGTLITSRLEHPSITAVAELLARREVSVIWLPVPSSGELDPDDVERALREAAGRGPVLVAVQAVNHETGVIQPLDEIVRHAEAHGADLHVDAVQGFGKLDAAAWAGATTVAMTAHKVRGPKGIGVLGAAPDRPLRPLLRGGSQERGLRPGTVDPVAATGLGVAAARATSGPTRHLRLLALRDQLEESLSALGERLGCRPVRNGGMNRLAHVSNLSWPGWSGDELVAALDLEGVSVSAGSACAAGTPEPSPVVTAMAGRERAAQAVRVSLGEDTTEEDVETAIPVFARVLARGPSPS
jgi:cysteine desulfurase